MGTKFRAGSLISRPSLFVLVAAGVLLPLTIFMLLRWWPRTREGHDLSELSVVHVHHMAVGRSQTGYFFMRDGSYYKNDDRVGFLGLSSNRKQYRDVLPPELSITQIKSITHSPEFESLFRNPQPVSSEDGWYVRAYLGSKHRCTILTEQEAANTAFAPVIRLIKDIEANSTSEKKFVRDCSNGDPDYVDHWCDDFTK